MKKALFTLLFIAITILSFAQNNKTIKDIDGNLYAIVQIGNQVWMAENLKTLHYSNGIEIQNVYTYNDDEINSTKFGRLYSWEAATNNQTGDLIQGVCPEGWHIPSDFEWKELEHYLGIEKIDIDSLKWRGSHEGGDLKEKGVKHWKSPNVGGTNKTGFTALPSGYRDAQGKYSFNSFYALFWTSSEFEGEKAWYRLLGYNLAKIGRSIDSKDNAYSVRCIKN